MHVEASSIVRNANLHELIQTGSASGSASSIQLKQASRKRTYRQSRQSLRLSISSLNFVLSIDYAVGERSASISVPSVHKKKSIL
jgi:hypothetical protein